MDEDPELIERFLAGDRNAGSRLVARHSQALFGWLRWKTGCHEDAEDLTQIVWSRAIPALAGLEDRTHLRAWLFTIMRREFIHWLRDHRPICSLDALHAHNENNQNTTESETLTSLLAACLPDAIAAATDRLVLQAALTQLSEEHRDTFMLRYLSQFSTAEVAHILEVPVGTVESRCHFARTRLRAWFLRHETIQNEAIQNETMQSRIQNKERQQNVDLKQAPASHCAVVTPAAELVQDKQPSRAKKYFKGNVK